MNNLEVTFMSDNDDHIHNPYHDETFVFQVTTKYNHAHLFSFQLTQN